MNIRLSATAYTITRQHMYNVIKIQRHSSFASSGMIIRINFVLAIELYSNDNLIDTAGDGQGGH